MNNENLNFGDYIRQELKNPDSYVSKAKHRLEVWKTSVKHNPEKYKITCNSLQGMQLEQKSRFYSVVEHGGSWTIGEYRDLFEFSDT